MVCDECGAEIEARYIDDESSKKYAYIISECNNCGKLLDKTKIIKESYLSTKESC